MRVNNIIYSVRTVVVITVTLSAILFLSYSYLSTTPRLDDRLERFVPDNLAPARPDEFPDNPIAIKSTKQTLIFPDHLQSGWTPPTLPDRLKHADQRDPELIQHIREHWIIPPFTGPRNLPSGLESKDESFDLSQQKQPQLIDKVLGHRRGGFVLECGAADGLITSNSLWLELHRGWTGLLIEANPMYFQKLLALKRHVYMLNACLSPTTKPGMLNFTTDGIGGGISDLVPEYQQKQRHMQQKKHAVIQCFPLYSILAAIDVMHVDYFSLDVEGAEVPVLRTIPFSDVTIDSFSIEKRVVNDTEGTKRKTEEIKDLLSTASFSVSTVKTLDIILVRKSQ